MIGNYDAGQDSRGVHTHEHLKEQEMPNLPRGLSLLVLGTALALASCCSSDSENWRVERNKQ